MLQPAPSVESHKSIHAPHSAAGRLALLPVHCVAVDTAHAVVECSGIGYCDRSTGVCQCAPGFDGQACDHMGCVGGTGGSQQTCNGRGVCLSMAQAAAQVDDKRLLHSTTYALWDADMMHGCVCDDGYSGEPPPLLRWSRPWAERLPGRGPLRAIHAARQCINE